MGAHHVNLKETEGSTDRPIPAALKVNGNGDFGL